MNPPTDMARDLCAYLDASPTPFHAVLETQRRLRAHGYVQLDEMSAWPIEAGSKVFVIRGDASLVAFHVGTSHPLEAGFRLVGAHTDSPNLRLKPKPDQTRSGFRQLGVEPYGGVLFHTWLDRDLSLAGRVLVRGQDLLPKARFVRFHTPLLRIPSLAIHLQRGVNTDGLVLNAQQHLVPLAGLELSGPYALRDALAAATADDGEAITPENILGFDLALYDTAPASIWGARGEFLASGRLDNLASCHASISALLAEPTDTAATRGIVLYDHEECGSRSARGADSPFLRAALERVCQAWGGASPDGFARAIARSFLISADMAHGIHPNYADKHEPAHAPMLGAGPVIKTNTNQSYATDGETASLFTRLCQDVGVVPQHFVTRSDLPCGSTIGPITAGQLGIRAIDVGNPMLSMHSAREMASTADVPAMIAVLRRFFSDETPLRA